MNVIEKLIAYNESKLSDIENKTSYSYFGGGGLWESQAIKRYKEMLETGISYDDMALLWAEHIGVYTYWVKGNKMHWISYFGSEGFYKVTFSLDTCEEIRKHQASTKREYNYFCG